MIQFQKEETYNSIYIYPKKLERMKNNNPLQATNERNACSGERLKKDLGSTNCMRKLTVKKSGPTVAKSAEMNAL